MQDCSAAVDLGPSCYSGRLRTNECFPVRELSLGISDVISCVFYFIFFFALFYFTPGCFFLFFLHFPYFSCLSFFYPLTFWIFPVLLYALYSHAFYLTFRRKSTAEITEDFLLRCCAILSAILLYI